ncbi:hypothetical protein [Actinomadura sp. WMMA1423]|uniref:hypothetical protein n=1 Tax=Actinomadura sp. WMMA1423 TaxID=2591108 RepID=UPI001146E0D0|nr:hypothetical protein [Actinomadura sp. WMMA1423]
MTELALADDDAQRLDYRFLVAVDLEGFSALSTKDQRAVQAALHGALDDAATLAGLDRSAWLRQVGGDGELSVLPAETDPVRLVAVFPERLADVLAHVNAARHPEPRIRVRVAIHHGTLASGCLGPVGRAPIIVSRLLDSGSLRRELARRTDTNLALIVSDSLYNDVIETQLGGLQPGAFRRVVVRAKKISYPAYIQQE